jgi:predicted transposase YdaD
MRYDITLKELLQAGAPRLWQRLVFEQPVEYLTVELPSVQMRKPDFLARLHSGALFHLELQGDNEPMEWRELEYYMLIYRLYGHPPIQVVLYFGKAPMTMRNTIAMESLQFRFMLFDIRSVSAKYLLGSDELSDNVLAILGAGGSEPEVIKELAGKLEHLPPKEQQDWLEKLMILSGLRGVEDLVREEAIKMGAFPDIRENKFYQEAFAAGIAEGIEKGVEEGESAFLTRMLERRFGPLPEWAREKIAQMSRAALEEAGVRLLEAEKLEDVFPPELSN